MVQSEENTSKIRKMAMIFREIKMEVRHKKKKLLTPLIFQGHSLSFQIQVEKREDVYPSIQWILFFPAFFYPLSDFYPLRGRVFHTSIGRGVGSSLNKDRRQDRRGTFIFLRFSKQTNGKGDIF